MDVDTAHDAARALGLALGLLGEGLYGEISVRFADGRVEVVRRMRTYKDDALRELPIPEDLAVESPT